MAAGPSTPRAHRGARTRRDPATAARPACPAAAAAVVALALAAGLAAGTAAFAFAGASAAPPPARGGGASGAGARAGAATGRRLRTARGASGTGGAGASPLLQPLKVASAGMSVLKPVFAAEAKVQALVYDQTEIRSKLASEISSAPVVVYTYSLSPFCTEAIKVLEEVGAQFKEVQLAPEWFLMVGEGAAKRAELGALYGRTSMPHIFIGGVSIGGLVDGTPGLLPLLESGELEERLKAAGALPGTGGLLKE